MKVNRITREDLSRMTEIVEDIETTLIPLLERLKTRIIENVERDPSIMLFATSVAGWLGYGLTGIQESILLSEKAFQEKEKQTEEEK